MSLTVQVAGKSDLGCVRTNNEDNFGYDARYGMFGVCDGMGGRAAGEVASKMGVDTVLELVRNGAGEEENCFANVSARAQRLRTAIRRANAAADTASHADTEHASM